MVNIFSRFCETIRRNKALFIVLILATIGISVLAIYSAINFESVAISIEIGNVSFIKFLRGDSGFIGFVFTSLLTSAGFYIIILLCCCKKFLFPVAVLFYLYFVYSQIVIFTSVMVIYGFFNVLILILCLLIFLLFEFFVFILLMLECLSICGTHTYFKDCFNSSVSCVGILSLGLVLLVLMFCLLITILKSFIILLIY